MSNDREFQIRGAPYRRLVPDLVWSAILVAATGIFLLNLDVPSAIVAVSCGALTAGLGRMIYGRVQRERARRAPAHRPRLSRIIERYGAPRRRPATRSMA